VPETAPMAKSTAVTRAWRRARVRQRASPVRRPMASASTISSGSPMPMAANTM
jgi:hypothetical protein